MGFHTLEEIGYFLLLFPSVKNMEKGPTNSPAGKAVCYKPCPSEFQPQDSHGRRGEAAPETDLHRGAIA